MVPLSLSGGRKGQPTASHPRTGIQVGLAMRMGKGTSSFSLTKGWTGHPEYVWWWVEIFIFKVEPTSTTQAYPTAGLRVATFDGLPKLVSKVN